MTEEPARFLVTKIPDGLRPTIVIAKDGNGLMFEAHVLRRAGHTIKIDVRMAECIPGGICAIRNGIEPYFDIVCEALV